MMTNTKTSLSIRRSFAGRNFFINLSSVQQILFFSLFVFNFLKKEIDKNTFFVSAWGSYDACPATEFREKTNEKVLFAKDATPENNGIGILYESTVQITCQSNNATNCICSSTYTENSPVGGEFALDVCCHDNSITNTWNIQTNAIPDAFAMITNPKGWTMKSQNFDVDIPTCPHANLNLASLSYQDETSWLSTGKGVLGFTLGGVPIYPPFDTTEFCIMEDTENYAEDTCQGNVNEYGVYSYHFAPICELGQVRQRKDCRYYSYMKGYSNEDCEPEDWPLNEPTLIGYAIDGFRIMAMNPLPYWELDNCNGKFTYDANTGKYSYAYWVTTNTTHRYFPYVIGCLGPGTKDKQGNTIDYTTISANLETTCYDATPLPTQLPTSLPTSIPTTAPTALPTPKPTPKPTPSPTTASPTSQPSPQPTGAPTTGPPTSLPTPLPTILPTTRPTIKPTTLPTAAPTAPTALPTSFPTSIPTSLPTLAPTAPTSMPTSLPTSSPTPTPPTALPTPFPTSFPTTSPTPNPTSLPTATPTTPTALPTSAPSPRPTSLPTATPTAPTASPTPFPTSLPSIFPTKLPSIAPTSSPTFTPTQPTQSPTMTPTAPTEAPTKRPTMRPTQRPTQFPTAFPTPNPTSWPTAYPTKMPSTATYLNTAFWRTGQYQADGCPNEFDIYENRHVRFGSYATIGIHGEIRHYYNLTNNITCNSNQPSNCYCRSDEGGIHSGDPSYPNICCVAKHHEKTFKINTTGIPDNYAQVYPATLYKAEKTFYDVDIPQCPHDKIDLNRVEFANTYTSHTLGAGGPIGFTIHGVPIWNPNLYHYDEANDECGGIVKSDNEYKQLQAPICMFGEKTDLSDCRYYSEVDGFSMDSGTTCTPAGWPNTWTVVGYAVDGFRIFASSTILQDHEVDNCNGRFTYNPATQKFTYAYYVTQDASTKIWPFTLGCFGPAKRWKNGTLIDYTHIKSKIDVSC